MKLEPKPRDPNDSPYFKFEKIGDKITGVFVKFGEVNGQFGPKHELLLRDRNGDQKIVSCGAQLKSILNENLDKIRGHVLTITFVSTKDTGKGNPMKVFDVDVQERKPKPAPATAPETDAGDDDIPF